MMPPCSLYSHLCNLNMASSNCARYTGSHSNAGKNQQRFVCFNHCISRAETRTRQIRIVKLSHSFSKKIMDKYCYLEH